MRISLQFESVHIVRTKIIFLYQTRVRPLLCVILVPSKRQAGRSMGNNRCLRDIRIQIGTLRRDVLCDRRTSTSTTATEKCDGRTRNGYGSSRLFPFTRLSRKSQICVLRANGTAIT
jgi:hypothetical protein